ncbi:MAG: hypothetical protein K0U12_03510 [Gammaproteobacteria bacterium]|nr:hypothetical protein [Gammaproteobacteria bacterium]
MRNYDYEKLGQCVTKTLNKQEFYGKFTISENPKDPEELLMSAPGRISGWVLIGYFQDEFQEFCPVSFCTDVADGLREYYVHKSAIDKFLQWSGYNLSHGEVESKDDDYNHANQQIFSQIFRANNGKLVIGQNPNLTDKTLKWFLQQPQVKRVQPEGEITKLFFNNLDAAKRFVAGLQAIGIVSATRAGQSKSVQENNLVILTERDITILGKHFTVGIENFNIVYKACYRSKHKGASFFSSKPALPENFFEVVQLSNSKDRPGIAAAFALMNQLGGNNQSGQFNQFAAFIEEYNSGIHTRNLDFRTHNTLEKVADYAKQNPSGRTAKILRDLGIIAEAELVEQTYPQYSGV